MQESRIEQKIEDIYGFVESCKMQSFSSTKVIVPKNDLYDLLDDLRRDAPEEIKRYRKMLSQRDAILEDAEKKAADILADAQHLLKNITLCRKHTSRQKLLLPMQMKKQNVSLPMPESKQMRWEVVRFIIQQI